jgi:hypothetical protein
MYCDINSNLSRVKTIIGWLINEVQSAGGDGDGIWYSKYYDIQDIKRIILTSCLLPDYWKLEEKNGELHVGENQEWLIITNNKDSFNNRPSWQQVSLVW